MAIQSIPIQTFIILVTVRPLTMHLHVNNDIVFITGHSADLVPSLAPECYFPNDWRGDWLWYETNRVEDVKIGPGQVSFSHLGNFICKGKHWLYKQYKMMSHYSNGW